MKINPNFSAFNISARGMNIQKKRMELIAQNIANTENTKDDGGLPYKRQFLSIESANNQLSNNYSVVRNNNSLRTTNPNHISSPALIESGANKPEQSISTKIIKDESEGELVYMPEHPEADENGYVMMPNINIVTEMVDMISATRSFEANLTAFNASKQIAKDSLEI